MCRFIPAYAGNSKQQKSEQNATTVHPRLRGELIAVPPFKQSRIGSSPLTRGTRTPVSTGSREPGFIPAYAGNSGFNPALRRSPTVHPRLRGELSKGYQCDPFSDGSSPLTRGTLFHEIVVSNSGRFIPAYAGNSFSLFNGRKITTGSSPLTRGTRKGQHYVTR